ncbi:hypothetical protein LTR51_005861 [Lithohypha guttulata]|nr:hypothetical protein LTR51_005861 [Lithohypha guttulata]
MTDTTASPGKNSNVTKYKTELYQMVNAQGQIPSFDDPDWQSLPRPTQALLNDAHRQQTPLIDTLRNLLKASDCRTRFTLIGRPVPKKMESVEEKLARPKVLSKSAKSLPLTDVNNDFISIRFQVVTPEDIKPLADTIRDVIKKADDTIYVTEDRSFLDARKMPTDLIYFASMYSQKAGYIAEIQIGLKLAFYALKQESMARNVPEERLRVDKLWEFYHHVKQLALKFPSGIVNIEENLDSLQAVMSDYITWLHAYDPKRALEEDRVLEETLRPWMEIS